MICDHFSSYSASLEEEEEEEEEEENRVLASCQFVLLMMLAADIGNLVGQGSVPKGQVDP